MGIETRKARPVATRTQLRDQNSLEHTAGCMQAQELLTLASKMRAEAKAATHFNRQVELAQSALIAERELRQHHSACPVCLAEEAQVAA
jgi:hypothetical protein